VNTTHRLRADTAWSGSLELGGPLVNFRYEEDVVKVDSIRGRWAGGVVVAHGLRYRSGETEVAMELEMRRVTLQGVLDFLRYRDVRGEGTLYGRLPVRVRWGKRPRLSFGEGYLEARPPNGTLQLSEAVARTVLGVKESVEAGTSDPAKTAQVMMIRALRDMAYTELKAVFSKEEGDWMTRVTARGYGPRGAPDNRVPIGGLNVNVNNLDRLLTSLVMPSLRGER
jgi:hypothetical protein